jgi:flagellin
MAVLGNRAPGGSLARLQDAAGLGISTKLEAQLRSYNQAVRNANDGISVVQTAEAGLNGSANILTRLRELAMQSASDGIGDSERAYIDTEAQQLLSELDRVAQTTEFNGKKLLDGSAVTLEFQVGVDGTSNDVISISTLDATTAASGAAASADPTATVMTLARTAFLASYQSGPHPGSPTMASDAALSAAGGVPGGGEAANALLEIFCTAYAEAGGVGAEGLSFDAMLYPAAMNAGIAAVTASGNGAGGDPVLRDTYQAFASSLVEHGGDLAQAWSDARDAATNALNAIPGADAGVYACTANAAAGIFGAGYAAHGGVMIDLTVTLGTAATNAGLAALGVGGGGGSSTGGLGVAGLSLASRSGALAALGTVDAALDKVSSARSTLGAAGNRLQAAITTIQATSESLSAANSRIKDVDVAEESSQLARNQILSQAAVAVLAQANQQPQLVLKLLG